MKRINWCSIFSIETIWGTVVS